MASTVTVVTLFTDLVDSTALSARVGPEASEVLCREHFAVLRAAVEGSEGREIKAIGDGLMVVFLSAERGAGVRGGDAAGPGAPQP